MDKPNKPYPGAPPTSPRSTPSPMPIFIPDPSLRSANFDQLLAQRGIRMLHRKAIPCMNMESTAFQAHKPDCPFCDDSGILYYEEKEIWGTFAGNSMQKTFEAHGVWETGTAVVTMPTMYPDGTQADFNTYDKLVIPDFTVRLWELKEYEPTSNDKQSLRYPIKKVEYASYIDNGTQVILQNGVDFNIDTDGKIEWISGKEPPYDNVNERGQVVGWAYFANPVYVVVQTLRELRMSQEMVDGQKQAVRLPQQILVKRDYLFDGGEKINPDTGKP